jgi:vacuolar-type H+-ATPase subunit H
VEEKLLEELQLNQDAVKRDVNSPLFMIREKEMEISGRVLAAKQEAERIVAEARRKAAEVINRAEVESEAAMGDHQTQLSLAAEAEVKALHDGFDSEVAPIREKIAQQKAAGVAAVVEMVTRV